MTHYNFVSTHPHAIFEDVVIARNRCLQNGVTSFARQPRAVHPTSDLQKTTGSELLSVSERIISDFCLLNESLAR